LGADPGKTAAWETEHNKCHTEAACLFTTADADVTF